MCNKARREIGPCVVRSGARKLLYSTQHALFWGGVLLIVSFSSIKTAPGIPAILAALTTAILIGSCATPEPAAVRPELRPPGETPLEPEPAEPAISREEVVSQAYSSIGLLVSAGDAEEAIAEYEKAQLENPDEPATRILLSNLYLFAGRLEEAKSILDSILEIEPSNADALYSRALIAGAEGATEEGRELLERLVETHPDHAEGWAALGELHLENRRYDDAASAFESSLASDKDNFVALIGLGNLHLRRDRPEEAEKTLTRAIEVSPDYAFAYSDRGRARAIQQNLAAAEEDMSTAIDLEPSYSWNYFDRGRIRLERRRFEEAVSDFTTAIEIDPNVFMSYIYRARAFVAMEHYGVALQDYETAMAMRPDYSPAYGPLGALYVIDGRPLDAAKWFRSAWDENRRRSWFSLLATLALREGGRDEEARQFLEEAAAELPRDSLYYEMAKFLLRPHYDARIRQLLQNEQNELLQGQLYFYLGWQYELNGSPASARAAYSTALDAGDAGLLEMMLAEERLSALGGGD